MAMELQSQNASIDQATADAVARNLWVAFNNVGLYGSNHPLTQQAITDVGAVLAGLLSCRDAITLHLQQDTLYCEDLRIEQRHFGRRLFARITEAGIQSVSFLAGIRTDELADFIGILIDSRTFPSVESMTQGLARKNAAHIRFNTIRYQKVMEGQMVVDESVGRVAKTLSPGIDIDNDVAILKRLAAAAPAADRKMASSIAARVAELRTIIDGNMRSASSSDELVAALAALNRDIARQLDIERASGAIMHASERALGDAERLTFDTLVRIVREEYHKGAVEIRRLAQIIRRLLPDVADLKRLLPRLKTALLGAGMSEDDYLRLMEELAGELEKDGLTDLLRKAGDEIGVPVEEILGDIRKNPETAVNLILLSNEIQSMIGLDSKQLQSLIGEYLERVTNELLLRGKTDEQSKKILAMQEAMGGVQETLIKSMADRGLNADAIAAMSSHLQRKIAEEVAKFSSAGAATAPPQSTATAAQTGEEAEDRQTRLPMPKGVLGPKGIRVFLDREIKRHRRYKTDLSCLCISALVPSSQTAYGEPAADVLADILRQICDIMSKTLRDLDLIGSLGSLGDNLLLVILSMTNEAGAQIVKQRLAGLFNNIRVTIGGAPVAPRMCISVSAFDAQLSPDLASYINLMTAAHRAEAHKAVRPDA